MGSEALNLTLTRTELIDDSIRQYSFSDREIVTGSSNNSLLVCNSTYIMSVCIIRFK